MSLRYMSERYSSNQRAQLPDSSFYGERNLNRDRMSPFFSQGVNGSADDSYRSKYSREERYISDGRIRERSFSPREQSHFLLRRTQEPDLRDYLDLSHKYNRKLSEIEREDIAYNRALNAYDRVSHNQNLDLKYDRFNDMKGRVDQEFIDLRNRESLSERDEKYPFDSERERRFSDFRDEKYDIQRDRYSPDPRDYRYLSQSRREDHLDCMDKIYSTFSRRDEYSPDYSERGRLSDFRRDWPSPERRKKSPDADRWHRDQHYSEFLEESKRPWQTSNVKQRAIFDSDRRYPDQSHHDYSSGSLRESKCYEPGYRDPPTEHWKDQYPEARSSFERHYICYKRMVPMCDGQILDSVKHQDRRMDFPTDLIWKNRLSPPWNSIENIVSTNISQAVNRRLGTFSPVNNTNPPVTGPSLSEIKQNRDPLPRLSVLIQYLYNFNQPLSVEHREYVKDMLLKKWNEYRMKRHKGNWLPRFLEYLPRHNGLAIVCADRRSFRWLLDQKLKGCDGFFFAATSATNPIKKVKLFFQIPDSDLTPNEILKKLQQCNRGNQIQFDRFRVLNCKKANSGQLSIIVLADSWSANKLKKKLNWRPRYGNQRIRMSLMGKKKKKTVPMQPGEVKLSTIKDQLNESDEFDKIEEDSMTESYDEL